MRMRSFSYATVFGGLFLASSPFFGWVVGSARASPLHLHDWQSRLAVRALLAFLPLLVVGLLVVCQRTRAMLLPLALSCAGALTSTPALMDLTRGPARFDASVRETRIVGISRGGGCCTRYAAVLEDEVVLRYGGPFAFPLSVGSHRVVALIHSGALLGVDDQPAMTGRGRNDALLFFAVALFLTTGGLLVTALRAERRASRLRSTLCRDAGGSGRWRRGRSTIRRVFLATKRFGESRELAILPWSAIQPTNARLRNRDGSWHLGQPCLFLPPLPSGPLIGRSERTVREALTAAGFRIASAPPGDTTPPKGAIELWERSLSFDEELVVFGRVPSASSGVLEPAEGIPLLVATAPSPVPGIYREQSSAPREIGPELEREIEFAMHLLGEGGTWLLSSVVTGFAAGLVLAAWFTG